MAQCRSRMEAEEIAAKHFKTFRRQMKLVVDSRSSSKGKDGSESPLYIFNDSVAGRFVIVSGDVRMKPILGFSDHALYNNKDVPPALKNLLESYEDAYCSLQADCVKTVKLIMPDVPDIKPMINTLWGQGQYYNELCPKKCPTGCVATAMAQIMKYYEYPEHGTGYYSYMSRSRRFNCSYDFSQTYDWDNVLNSYSFHVSQNASDLAVANIMYACGVSVSMDYDTNGSGAYAPDIPYALSAYFRYNPNVRALNRVYYQPNEWYEFIYDELRNGSPVLYCGADYSEGGHAFIIDGCDSSNGKFHVNWGWDGNYDGLYELDALDPSRYRFSSYQEMINGFTPHLSGSRENIFYSEKFSIKGTFGIGEKMVFSLSELYCYANTASYSQQSAKFSGKVGIGLYDDEKQFVSPLTTKKIEGLNVYSGYDVFTLDYVYSRDRTFSDGKYYIIPYVCGTDDSVRTRIRTRGGDTDWVAITVKDGKITLGDSPQEEPHGDTVWIQDFENGIPDSWFQEQISGGGNWTILTPMSYSEQQPPSVSGASYAKISYDASGVINLPATISRITTDDIILDEQTDYELSVYCRKYSKQADAKVILKINSQDKSGSWHTLSEYQVTNSKDWNHIQVSLKGRDCGRLAFEGRVDRGSVLFIDNIQLQKSAVLGVNLNIADRYCNTLYYTLSGYETSNPQQGIYICNGKKVFVK